MKLKIGFVFNKIEWPTIQQKVDAILAFYKPDFDFDYTIFHTDYSNIPFVPVNTIGGISNTPGTTNTPDADWYDKNVSSLCRNADIILFVMDRQDLPPMQTSVGICQGMHNDIIQTCIFGINETNHAYQYANGLEIDMGNCFEVFAEHEISHALYLIQEIPDNTHLYFYSAQPQKVLPELKNGKLTYLYALLASLKQKVLDLTIQTNQQKIRDPLSWDTAANCEHSVRIICDNKGLNVGGKDTIQACVHQESDFMNYHPDGTPVIHQNLNKDGSLSSTDWGIVQINDHYHIGPNLDFPSVDFVMKNPQKMVEFMIDMYKAGKLALWSSYKTGAYKKYLKL